MNIEGLYISYTAFTMLFFLLGILYKDDYTIQGLFSFMAFLMGAGGFWLSQSVVAQDPTNYVAIGYGFILLHTFVGLFSLFNTFIIWTARPYTKINTNDMKLG